MSISDRAKEARATADRTGDPGDVRLAMAMEEWEAAEARELLNQLREERDLTGLPTPPMENIAIPRPPSHT